MSGGEVKNQSGPASPDIAVGRAADADGTVKENLNGKKIDQMIDDIFSYPDLENFKEVLSGRRNEILMSLESGDDDFDESDVLISVIEFFRGKDKKERPRGIIKALRAAMDRAIKNEEAVGDDKDGQTKDSVEKSGGPVEAEKKGPEEIVSVQPEETNSLIEEKKEEQRGAVVVGSGTVEFREENYADKEKRKRKANFERIYGANVYYEKQEDGKKPERFLLVGLVPGNTRSRDMVEVVADGKKEFYNANKWFFPAIENNGFKRGLSVEEYKQSRKDNFEKRYGIGVIYSKKEGSDTLSFTLVGYVPGDNKKDDVIEVVMRDGKKETHDVGWFIGAVKNQGFKREDKIEKNKDGASEGPEQDNELIRTAANITLNRLNDYEDVNASKLEEGDERFKEQSRKLWTDLVVHGRVGMNDKTKEIEIRGTTDLDGRTSLELLKLAGINVKGVQYVAPGEHVSGKINIDTGNQDGLVILEDGTVIIDHHDPESKSDSSATSHMYKILTGLGLMDKKDYLDRMVEFVDQVDNFKYPDSGRYFENYFKNSWKTLLGMYRMASMKNLSSFFEYRVPKTGRPLSPADPISEGLLKKFGFIYEQKGLKNKSESQRESVMKSKEELEKMEKEGFIVESDRYGKICISVDGRVPCGADAAKAFGCDAFIAWNTKENNFFITSLTGKQLEDDFGAGRNVRGTMWVRPLNKDMSIKIGLGEILDKMTDGKLKSEGELAELLKKDEGAEPPVVSPVEAPEKEKGSDGFSEEEKEALGIYVEDARIILESIEKADYVKEYDLEELDVSAQIKILKNVFWKRFEKEISDEKIFSEDGLKKAMESIKKEIEK